MVYEEVAPHLNKIAKLDLRNNKRKVGWLFVQPGNHEHLADKVHFVNVLNGKRHLTATSEKQEALLNDCSELINLEDIISIRSAR